MSTTMKVRRLDHASFPGGSVNRDQAGWTPAAAWVLDAATPLFPEADPVSRDYVQRVSSWLSAQVSDASATLPEIISAFLEMMGNVLGSDRPGEDRASLPSSTVGIVRWDGPRLEYFLLGDVTVVISRDGALQVLTDDRIARLDQAAVEAIHALQRQGIPFAEARRRLLPILREHRRRMNTLDGYWVLSADPAAAAHALHGRLALGETNRILLMTDGFSRCVGVLGVFPSWENLLATAGSEGVSEIVRRIRTAEAADPECLAHPRLSPSDDATAVYLEISLEG